MSKKLDNVRVGITTSRENNERWTKWAKELGMSKSQYMNMCCVVGSNVLRRQMSPEEFVTAELLEKLQQHGFFPSESEKESEKDS